MLPIVSDVTHILRALDRGDPQAAAQLLPLVYDELRKLATQRLAHEAPGQTAGGGGPGAVGADGQPALGLRPRLALPAADAAGRGERVTGSPAGSRRRG
jgi:hypothetical protein